MDRDTPLFSFILPVRNQAQELALFLLTFFRHFESRQESFEIVVVDDGSTDQTSSMVQKFQVQFPEVRLRILEKPKGLGVAVREGIVESRGAFVVIIRTNSSLSYIDQLIDRVSLGFDGLMIGRIKFRSSLYPLSLTFFAIWNGFDWLFNKLFLPGGLSPRFAPILISQTFARELAQMSRVAHSGYQFEFVFLAQEKRKIIHQVHLSEPFFVKGLPFFYFLTVFKELLRLRWRAFRKK